MYSRADMLHQLIMKLTLLISDQIILINGQSAVEVDCTYHCVGSVSQFSLVVLSSSHSAQH